MAPRSPAASSPRGAIAALSALDDSGVPPGTSRTYTLRIVNHSTTFSGTLNSWSITFKKPGSGTGLGEAVADRVSAGFRIFTTAPADPLSSSTWTPLGPQSVDNDGPIRTSRRHRRRSLRPLGQHRLHRRLLRRRLEERRTSSPPPPADPPGFPLTDFGPTIGLNIGSIVVFPQNNDPNQSILFAATGQPDSGNRGAGILRSNDGGASWTLLDSSNNNLAFASRDHQFARSGAGAYTLAVDPRRGPTGVIVYARHDRRPLAIAGHRPDLAAPRHRWPAPASSPDPVTDVVLDLGSGTFDSLSNPFGNAQIVYAAVQGQGVFQSTNKGDRFALINGGVGKPNTRDGDPFSIFTGPVTGGPVIPVENLAANPNGAGGRIALAKPEPPSHLRPRRLARPTSRPPPDTTSSPAAGSTPPSSRGAPSTSTRRRTAA